MNNSCTKSEDRPNIIYILADDLGYGELGVYGQKIIETPNIDALARSGMRFTDHYSGSPVCAPSRSVFMTGQHTGHTPIRGNDEWKERGDTWNYQAMFDNPFLEGQRPIPDSTITIAEVLKVAGYTTGMVGKWGLGAPTTEGLPNKQGFDFFYGYNCQRQAHTLYPMHLWRNNERHILNNKNVSPHANLAEGADPHDLSSYNDFELNDYAPELMHNEALQFLDDNKDRPFFLYYASPIPHVPLQAPKKWVDYYRVKLGEETPYIGKSYFPNQYPRATYAAMISYLDEQVGDLVNKLLEIGQYENTLIIFTSDNGPTYTGGADTPFFDSAKPFKSERGWAKGFVHEGGIRVPMIASWPGKIKNGSRSNHMSAFQDMMPTFAEVSGATVAANIDGISLLPTLLGKDQTETHDYLYWEFPAYKGQQAVRLGNWKGIRRNIFEGNMTIELYNLDRDIQEQYDIARSRPDLIEQIEKIMEKSHIPSDLERFKFPQLGD
ncbi:MAG: arylsulfatase [Candidatus Marinimicrobia bacterium]|nr:arylsulfatase [Candidatus Neomarinimicrobiota bacterium]MDP6610991.1 arylsulfatase [Candidatus Neomarinimicrobiota bacterium]